MCIGARIAGASVWLAAQGVMMFLLWIVVIASEPGPEDPTTRDREKAT
jgi:hypothetical protein